jgi:hypothetical protein
MDDEFFDALRRTGDAWEAYLDAERGDGAKTETKRCDALWAEFQKWVLKLSTIRENRKHA